MRQEKKKVVGIKEQGGRRKEESEKDRGRGEGNKKD